MKKLLENLGFTQKETEVYLALIEFGNQPASQIAKKTGYPKSTVLFLFDHLLKEGYIRKSNRGRIQYFYADPKDLKTAKEKQFDEGKKALNKAIPLLEEFKTPFSSEPKVTFYEGVEGCKKAYSMLLESPTEVLEFGAHGDLVNKLGEDFMNDFIAKRVKNKVFLKAISKKDEIHKKLSELDKKHLREIQFYPSDKGTLYSSIAIFEDRVLLLNLYHDAFAILIENKEVAETLKTIHRLQWKDK
jgi:HTH-type transcriptional regulator, sugar sensing transcriptional regulator